jgi:hypothetical protein
MFSINEETMKIESDFGRKITECSIQKVFQVKFDDGSIVKGSDKGTFFDYDNFGKLERRMSELQKGDEIVGSI